jgi:CHAT domain-containing protein
MSATSPRRTWTRLENEFRIDDGRESTLEQYGVALAETILPSTVRRELYNSRGHHLVVVHDSASSRIPWETLRIAPNGGTATWAPARDAGLSHRLHTENLPLANWLERRRSDRRINVLLIVDPRQDLRGAREEGERIAALASKTTDLNLIRLEGAEATVAAVVGKLRSGEFDLVHYAGHAYFDPRRRSESGLLCADGVLRGSDLDKTFNLPSLVFFNACESARLRRGEAPRRKTAHVQVSQSLSVAETILRAGIANVLGTYWPVGDAAAKEFSEKFYPALLEGATLGDAIQRGRKAVAEVAKSVDWADYVFYGSSEFMLKLPAS